MMKAISTVLLVLSTFFGYNQVWVHPMASKLPNQTIVYYLNGDRDPIPEGTSYAYKRLASPRNEYSYFEIEEYYPSGKPYFIGKASEADPISTSYFGNTLWLYESGDTMSFQAYQGKAKQGLFLAKYENGQVKTQGQYHDDEQHGLWLYYSEAGHLSDSGVMEHGKHVGTWVSYSDSGALASTVTYVDGLYEGVR
jgi:antitoxin component YwqK of YwqJK toxin-antitoxin module